MADCYDTNGITLNQLEAPFSCVCQTALIVTLERLPLIVLTRVFIIDVLLVRISRLVAVTSSSFGSSLLWSIIIDARGAVNFFDVPCSVMAFSAYIGILNPPREMGSEKSSRSLPVNDVPIKAGRNLSLITSSRGLTNFSMPGIVLRK